MTDGPAIVVRDVSFSYGARAEAVISGISLDVRRGERLGILGPNGGGKSTLLRLLLGELEPTDGEIRVLGVTPGEARAAGQIGYVPQRVTAELGFPLSVRQVVEQAVATRVPAWRGIGNAARERVQRSLELGLTVVVVSHELATIAATSDRVACLRRTLHFHDAPHGLTPGVLAELFSHDVAVVSGGAHVHACDDTACAHGSGDGDAGGEGAP